MAGQQVYVSGLKLLNPVIIDESHHSPRFHGNLSEHNLAIYKMVKEAWVSRIGN